MEAEGQEGSCHNNQAGVGGGPISGGSGVGEKCWLSGCLCYKWSKWDFPPGLVVGMKKERSQR